MYIKSHMDTCKHKLLDSSLDVHTEKKQNKTKHGEPHEESLISNTKDILLWETKCFVYFINSM